VAECKTLKEAAEICEFRPKTLSDFKAIMGSGKKRKFSKVEFDCDKEFICAPEDWDPKKKTLIIWGDSGAGKSNWVRNYFGTGCYEVAEVEDLKDIPEDAAGILYDDQEYAKLKLQTQKSITDCRGGRSIKMRNVNGYKPHLPAIMTCNDLDTCVDLRCDAIVTRTYIWDVRGKKMHY
jgi:hypothetical protein